MLGHHLLQLRDLLVQGGDDADLPRHDGGVGGVGGRRLPQRRGPQHRQQGICLGLDVMPARGPQRRHHLAAGQPRRPRRRRRPPQQQQRVLRRQILERLDGGREVFAQHGSQSQYLTGPLPDRGLVRPRQQLHRIDQVGVAGDLPVMVTIEPDDLGQHVSITGIALGTRGGVPFPVPGRRQRVDREHPVAGPAERRHPWAAVGLDPDDHLTGDLLGRQIGPGRRGVLGDQRMPPGDALQSLRQAGLGQPPPGLVLDLDVVVVFGPVVPDEQQHPQQLLQCSPDKGHSTRRHLRPNDQVLTPRRARHPISSRSPANRRAHDLPVGLPRKGTPGKEC